MDTTSFSFVLHESLFCWWTHFVIANLVACHFEHINMTTLATCIHTSHFSWAKWHSQFLLKGMTNSGLPHKLWWVSKSFMQYFDKTHPLTHTFWSSLESEHHNNDSMETKWLFFDLYPKSQRCELDTKPSYQQRGVQFQSLQVQATCECAHLTFNLLIVSLHLYKVCVLIVGI